MINNIHEDLVVTWAATGGAATKSDPFYLGGATIVGVYRGNSALVTKVTFETSEDGISFRVLQEATVLDTLASAIGVPPDSYNRAFIAIGPWARLSVSTGTVTEDQTMGVITRPRSSI